MCFFLNLAFLIICPFVNKWMFRTNNILYYFINTKELTVERGILLETKRLDLSSSIGEAFESKQWCQVQDWIVATINDSTPSASVGNISYRSKNLWRRPWIPRTDDLDLKTLNWNPLLNIIHLFILEIFIIYSWHSKFKVRFYFIMNKYKSATDMTKV